jgi:prepilin-type N-terminal cleavage/methylation domain-containing protein
LGTQYGKYEKTDKLSFLLMKHSNPFRRAAFTLAEVMVALGIFGITATAAVSAMLRMNNNAALSRLQTGASTVAQNQIDLCLSDSPFNPQKNQVPPALTAGTTKDGTPTVPTIPVYTDPKSGMKVMGWMVTEVVDTTTTLGGNNLNIYQITVTVNYKFKGRPYSVKMGTVRASDI